MKEKGSLGEVRTVVQPGALGWGGAGHGGGRGSCRRLPGKQAHCCCICFIHQAKGQALTMQRRERVHWVVEYSTAALAAASSAACRGGSRCGVSSAGTPGGQARWHHHHHSTSTAAARP